MSDAHRELAQAMAASFAREGVEPHIVRAIFPSRDLADVVNDALFPLPAWAKGGRW